MKRFVASIFLLVVCFALPASADVKRPAGLPWLKCTQWDPRCEEMFLVKANTVPDLAKDAQKVAADLRASIAAHPRPARPASGSNKAITTPPGSDCASFLGGIWCWGDEGIDIYYLSAATGGGGSTTTPPRIVTAKAECKVFDGGCIENIRKAILGTGFKPRYDGQMDFILSEVKKAYDAGAKSRAAKERSFDYYVADPRLSPTVPKMHIHIGWGELILFAVALAL